MYSKYTSHLDRGDCPQNKHTLFALYNIYPHGCQRALCIHDPAARGSSSRGTYYTDTRVFQTNSCRSIDETQIKNCIRNTKVQPISTFAHGLTPTNHAKQGRHFAHPSIDRAGSRESGSIIISSLSAAAGRRNRTQQFLPGNWLLCQTVRSSESNGTREPRGSTRSSLDLPAQCGDLDETREFVELTRFDFYKRSLLSAASV